MSAVLNLELEFFNVDKMAVNHKLLAYMSLYPNSSQLRYHQVIKIVNMINSIINKNVAT